MDSPVETAFVGSLVLTNAVRLPDVADLVLPEDIWSVLPALTYEVVLDISSREELVDPVTVLAGLNELPGWHRDARAAVFIAELYEKTPSLVSTLAYARVVLARSVSREIRMAGIRLVQMIDQGGTTDAQLRVVSESYQAIHDTTARYRLMQERERKQAA